MNDDITAYMDAIKMPAGSTKYEIRGTKYEAELRTSYFVPRT
jgi:hypothetical protein